ncbi:hypothetical protein HOR75_gp06 [Shewanella phage SppYZU05]|uniref:Phage protein Gp138 N-terminal domain-containing protein n=1 Tax=Shewanella phage SppYZU05 TaxID=1970795 RepID=A0A1W6JTD9_9CAUD|nr:hypothetical protein HOR75_gp06 [Shewanella phage SppYZU05]ARM70532.1 hypothetical protein SppYZU05_06 [Shewanella phage SppYZU05]
MQINTKTLGTIKSFDPVTQFATVEIICNDTASTLDQNYVNVDPTVLIDVMVEFPRDNMYCVTFPIKGGEDCIVEFFEQGISHWQYENRRKYNVVNGRPEAAARRRFDRSDAVCRVSVGNLKTAIPNFNTSAFEIRNMEADQFIRLQPNGDVLIHTTGNIHHKAGGNYTVEAEGNIQLTAGGDFTAQGTNASLRGSVIATIKGGITQLIGSAIKIARG